jgi:20S proteasome alpha/beta subunit
MFNFSANHLALISRTEYRSCIVFIMRDDSTRRLYRLHDFTKSQQISPYRYYCVSGKVNSADKLYLVIESVKADHNHPRSSNAPVPADGAGRATYALIAPAPKNSTP